MRRARLFALAGVPLTPKAVWAVAGVMESACRQQRETLIRTQCVRYAMQLLRVAGEYTPVGTTLVLASSIPAWGLANGCRAMHP